MFIVILQVIPVLLFSYTAQVLFKIGANQVFAGQTTANIFEDLPGLILKILLNWQMMLGFVLAGIGAIFYIVALSKADFTVVFPILGALGFVILPIIGYFILHESITPGRILGTIIISVGMLIVAMSNK